MQNVNRVLVDDNYHVDHNKYVNAFFVIIEGDSDSDYNEYSDFVIVDDDFIIKNDKRNGCNASTKFIDLRDEPSSGPSNSTVTRHNFVSGINSGPFSVPHEWKEAKLAHFVVKFKVEGDNLSQSSAWNI